MAKYIATKRGHDGNKVIEVGEVFEFDGPKGSWMEKADGSDKPGNKHVLASGKAKDHELALQEEHSHDDEGHISTKGQSVKPASYKSAGKTSSHKDV